jgi:hypothetical protein
VDHGIHRRTGEHLGQRSTVTDVDLVELDIPPRQLHDALDCGPPGVRQVVDDHDVVAEAEQLDRRVAPDVAGSAGQHYAHARNVPVPPPQVAATSVTPARPFQDSLGRPRVALQGTPSPSCGSG